MKNLIILLVAITMLSSCGRDGAPGAQGPKGNDGNANVFSVVYDISTWGYNGTSHYYFANLPVPEITSSVISGGTVQVFEGDQPTGSANWYAIPYSFNGLEVSYVLSYGNVKIEVSSSNGTLVAPSGNYQYKVGVIPPI